MPRTTTQTPLTGKTKQGDVLTEREELFCNLYVRDFKRIEAVLESYDVDTKKPNWRDTAKSIAYENLLKPHINRRIRELLDKYHLNDEAVDGELSLIIQQNAEFNAKNKAIDIYNRLKNRYEDDNARKLKFEGVGDEELRERAAQLIAGTLGDTGGTGSPEPGESLPKV